VTSPGTGNPGAIEAGIDVVDCSTCGHRTPAGSFCGACGSGLRRGGSPRGLAEYSADPAEKVLRPWIVSTLFPYLPRRASAPFRIALLVGVLILVLLGLLRLTGPAIVASAVLLPALYLIYLFEVGVYEDQPWRVIVATLVVGVALGLLWSRFVGPMETQALVSGLAGRLGPTGFLAGAVIAPLAALVLMLVGPSLLYMSRRFEHALDGFTFGVASALGFSLGATIAQVGAVLGDAPTSAADPLTYTLEVLRRGVAGPLVSATLAGLIAAAFWLHRQPPGLRPRGRLTSRGAAVGIAVATEIGLGVAGIVFTDGRWQFVAWVGAALVLMVVTRLVLHAILLSEAHHVVIGPLQRCPQCQESVPSMPFCVICGIARRATPKLGRLADEAGRLQ
jgi:hypothetical protein